MVVGLFLLSLGDSGEVRHFWWPSTVPTLPANVLSAEFLPIGSDTKESRIFDIANDQQVQTSVFEFGDRPGVKRGWNGGDYVNGLARDDWGLRLGSSGFIDFQIVTAGDYSSRDIDPDIRSVGFASIGKWNDNNRLFTVLKVPHRKFSNVHVGLKIRVGQDGLDGSEYSDEYLEYGLRVIHSVLILLAIGGMFYGGILLDTSRARFGKRLAIASLFLFVLTVAWSGRN
jgi:hypothetical protein